MLAPDDAQASGTSLLPDNNTLIEDTYGLEMWRHSQHAILKGAVLAS